MGRMDRREFVGAIGGGAAGMFATAEGLFGQPAHEGAARHKVEPLKFAPGSLRGISETVVNWHHDKHYAGYVKKRNAIDGQLANVGSGMPGFDRRVHAGLKREESFNSSGMILHEAYFDNLGGDGKPGKGAIERAIQERFGSVEQWMGEMRAVGAQATGWALLCYDPSDERLHVYLVDGHQLGAVWGAIPIVAMDVFEHAYYHDYGPDRGKYMEAFFGNLHWGRIGERYAGAAGTRT